MQNISPTFTGIAPGRFILAEPNPSRMAKTTPSGRAKSKDEAPKRGVKVTQLDRIEDTINALNLFTVTSLGVIMDRLTDIEAKLASPTVAVEDIKPKELKVGDWVVSLKDIWDLKKNHVYLVQKTDGFIGLDGVYGGWFPDRFRPATPEEIAAHEAKVKAEAQAAEDAKLVFGARVESVRNRIEYRLACDSPDANGKYRLAPKQACHYDAPMLERHEFTLLP